MIEHLVLFKLKPGATPAQEESMLRALRGLPSSVDAIQELSCGTNFSTRSQGFTHALRVLVRSKEDLQAYLEHPEHQRVVAEHVRPAVDGILAVDYER